MAIRVFEPQTLATGAEIPLGDRNVQHLVRALRLGPGDAFVVFNGDGSEYGAQIVSAGKRDCVARIGARREPAVESSLQTHLGQVMSKGDRMEYAVQKAAELGVSEITPLSSARCDIRLDDERLEKKREHLQMVAVAACEQSGRVLVPTVHTPMALEKWITKVQAGLKVVLHPGEGAATLPDKCISSALLVGPEGGLTAEEVAAAQKSGFAALALGPRVLRTETAPVAALAFLQARYGDFT
ncbi:MAG: 16S rRNA (uracil(1498)-N(3))-methyltransferase [Gammaproteobacteria bacterium]